MSDVNVVMLTVVMLTIVILHVIMLSVVMLNVIMLTVIMLNVIMMNVTAPIFETMTSQAGQIILKISNGVKKTWPLPK